MSPRNELPVVTASQDSRSSTPVSHHSLEPDLIEAIDSLSHRIPFTSSPFASPVRVRQTNQRENNNSSSTSTHLSSRVTQRTITADNNSAPATTSSSNSTVAKVMSDNVISGSAVVPTNVTQIELTTDQSSAKHSIFGIDMPFDVISAGFAALVATGGIIGYAKAGSIPSLAAGLTFGGILGVGAYLTSVNPNNYYLTAATSAVLTGMMGYRFYNSGKFMPAGLIAILGAGMLARYGIYALTNNKSQRVD